MTEEIKTYCYECDSETHQKPLYSKKKTGTDPSENIASHYIALECCGCKSISFLVRSDNPNALPDDEKPYFDRNYSGNSIYDDEEFNFLREKDYDMLPATICKIYDEVELTLLNDAPITAGIALRTLVEAICIQQKVPGRNLQQKIENLHKKGLISSAELPILDKLRLIGNQSTHQIKSFSLEKLYYALEIVNHVLVSVFVLPKINKKLNIK